MWIYLNPRVVYNSVKYQEQAHVINLNDLQIEGTPQGENTFSRN